MGGVNLQVTKQEMAMSLAAAEVLVLATEDNCFSWSSSKNRGSIDGDIRAYRLKAGLAQKASKTSELLWRSHSRTL